MHVAAQWFYAMIRFSSPKMFCVLQKAEFITILVVKDLWTLWQYVRVIVFKQNMEDIEEDLFFSLAYNVVI